MTGAESRLLEKIDRLGRDEIDDLVDAQMRQTRSGYDYNINQVRCAYCGEDSHSLPIKERMQELRSLWHSTITYADYGSRASERAVAELNAYRYDKDDSPIVCPGLEFVGPIATPWHLARNRRRAERERQIDEYLAGDPSYQRLRPAVENGIYMGTQETLGCFYAGLPLPDPAEDESEWEIRASFGPFARSVDPWRDLHGAFEAVNGAARQMARQFSEAFTPWALPEIRWPEQSAPRWWRCVVSPELEIEITTEREHTDVAGGMRRLVVGTRRRMRIRSGADTHSCELCTDPETGNQAVQRIEGDIRTLEVFLSEPPPIGDWVPVEPDPPPEPVNRRQRRGRRESTAPMWARPLDGRRRQR